MTEDQLAEKILREKLKGFLDTLKAFGRLTLVVEAMKEYSEIMNENKSI